MELTPKGKYKLSTESNDDRHVMPGNSSTPMQSKATALYDECSPIFVPCTQEAYDQLDVVWDWNSPQSKPKQTKSKQRRREVRSPKAAAKKYSHNQPVVNEKVKSQLEKLRNQLETELRPSSSHKASCTKLKNDLDDLEDLFNDDSIEQELILQSQKVENLMNLELKEGACDIKSNLSGSGTALAETTAEFRKVKSDNRLNESSSRTMFKVKSTSSGNLYVSPRQKAAASVRLESKFETTFNDSFDLALQSFKDVDFKTGNSSERLKCKSDSSMSMSFVEDISSYDMQEIERKRQEALAKLRAKKLHNVISPSKRNHDSCQTTTENVTAKVPKAEESPIKCSPEEIEQKRLQALAKLEAKKKQDVIEKNRRDALKRLEMSKKKRAMLLQNIRS